MAGRLQLDLSARIRRENLNSTRSTPIWEPWSGRDYYSRLTFISASIEMALFNVTCILQLVAQIDFEFIILNLIHTLNHSDFLFPISLNLTILFMLRSVLMPLLGEKQIVG